MGGTGQTLEGSFSAVSKPIVASEYSASVNTHYSRSNLTLRFKIMEKNEDDRMRERIKLWREQKRFN